MSNIHKIIRAFTSGTFNDTLKEKVWRWLINPKDTAEKEATLQTIWNECSTEANSDTHKSYRKFRKHVMTPSGPYAFSIKKLARIAAILLIPLLSVISAYFYVQTHTPQIELIQCSVPEGGEQKVIILPDGSEVNLNAGTLLIYPNQFVGKFRSVFLTGEADFNVTKDKKHPFIVKTNHLKVRVLGTRFNVQAYAQDEKTVTTLEHGSVAIQKADSEENLTVLTPNEQLEYNNRNGEFSKKNIDASLYSGWTKGELNFLSQPLKEIVRTLERTYGVSILIDPHLLTPDLYTIKFKKRESIENVLSIITKTVGNITCKQDDENTIRIYSLKKKKGEP
ncbi:FecR family protein [Bacteroides sp.]